MKNTLVSVHYTGSLSDGTIFDSSKKRNEPLSFSLGQGQVIAGFENAVKDLEVGQTVKVTIPPKDAYGEYNEKLLITLPLELIPPDIDLHVGQMLQLPLGNGQGMTCSVKEINDQNVVIDGNHELAGKELNFEIELLSRTEA